VQIVAIFRSFHDLLRDYCRDKPPNIHQYFTDFVATLKGMLAAHGCETWKTVTVWKLGGNEDEKELPKRVSR
jgi:hypothetical protein